VKSYLGMAFRQLSRAKRKLWIVFFVFIFHIGTLIVTFGHFCEKTKVLNSVRLLIVFVTPRTILFFALICMLTVVASSRTACCSLSRLLSLSVYLSAAACCTPSPSDSRAVTTSLSLTKAVTNEPASEQESGKSGNPPASMTVGNDGVQVSAGPV
jgi:hypothetical protein